MPALVAGIHVLFFPEGKVVDGRDHRRAKRRRLSDGYGPTMTWIGYDRRVTVSFAPQESEVRMTAYLIVLALAGLIAIALREGFS